MQSPPTTMPGNTSGQTQLSDQELRDLNMTIEMFGRNQRQIREPYLSLILSAYFLIILAAGTPYIPQDSFGKYDFF